MQNGITSAYLFYNSFLFISLFWALAHKDLEEPIFFAAGINAVYVIIKN